MGPDAGSLECGALKDFSGLIAAAWRKAAKTLHGRGWSAAGMDPDIVVDPGVMPLVEATASVLDSAIEQAPMSEAMRDSLRRSNFIFSGLKTFHELNEAFPSLVDTSGNLKPFEQFLTDVQTIDNTYNRNYLRAEYNFAVASAQSAARWEEFEAGGDRYDLQYRTAGDGRVRPEHAALDRITLPVSSPFWDSFMPPNGWNCRCSVVQVRKGKYPNIDIARALELGEEATSKDKRGMLRFNPGKERSVWPKYNPYTIRRCRDCDIANGKDTLARLTPPDINVCTSCRLCRQLSITAGYTPHPKYGNRLLISNSADITEVEDNKRAAISMLESFPEMSIKIRPHVFIHGVKNPEYEIDGLIADRKGIMSEKGVTAGFKAALEQGCKSVIIDLDMRMASKSFSLAKIARRIAWRVKDFESHAIECCYVICNGKTVQINLRNINNDSVFDELKKIEP